MLPLSVLLPVYDQVSPHEFQRAYESVEKQTSPAEEIIVVVDGPVNPTIDAYLATKKPERLTLIRFKTNQGLAAGMRSGFNVARNRWIARQDADDVSLPERFSLQWPFVQSGRYAAVGASMLEFEDDPTRVVRRRALPTSPAAIERYAKINNPINHPTAILDRDAVADVGGIKDLHYMEDYDLFARLLAFGYKLRNIEDPVVLFNAGPDMFERRSGKEMARSERQLQKNLVKYGLISTPRAFCNYAMRQSFRKLPTPLLRSTYSSLFNRENR